MARDAVIYLTLDEIVIPEGRRPVQADSVRTLAQSIEKIGLQTPITCRKTGGVGFDLVAGRHRLEAFRILKRESIPAVIVKVTDREARRWEIAENLHRADLTELERKEQIAEWIALAEADRLDAEKVSRQVDGKPQGGRPEGGISAAARELGVQETEARRAVKIGSIGERAREAAIAAKLDDNQSALLRIARAEPERQVETVQQITAEREAKAAAQRKPISPAPAVRNEYESYQAFLNKVVRLFDGVPQEWREAACEHVLADTPVMDRGAA